MADDPIFSKAQIQELRNQRNAGLDHAAEMKGQVVLLSIEVQRLRGEVAKLTREPAEEVVLPAKEEIGEPPPERKAPVVPVPS